VLSRTRLFRPLAVLGSAWTSSGTCLGAGQPPVLRATAFWLNASSLCRVRPDPRILLRKSAASRSKAGFAGL